MQVEVRDLAPPSRDDRLPIGSEPIVHTGTPEGYMAALPGLEPGTTESKSGVLPLHYRAKSPMEINCEYNLHHYRSRDDIYL